MFKLYLEYLTKKEARKAVKAGQTGLKKYAYSLSDKKKKKLPGWFLTELDNFNQRVEMEFGEKIEDDVLKNKLNKLSFSDPYQRVVLFNNGDYYSC